MQNISIVLHNISVANNICPEEPREDKRVSPTGWAKNGGFLKNRALLENVTSIDAWYDEAADRVWGILIKYWDKTVETVGQWDDGPAFRDAVNVYQREGYKRHELVGIEFFLEKLEGFPCRMRDVEGRILRGLKVHTVYNRRPRKHFRFEENTGRRVALQEKRYGEIGRTSGGEMDRRLVREKVSESRIPYSDIANLK